MFNKKEYRERREQGLRGQGDFRFKKRGFAMGDGHGGIVQSDIGYKPVSKKALKKNTKRARKAQNVQG